MANPSIESSGFAEWRGAARIESVKSLILLPFLVGGAVDLLAAPPASPATGEVGRTNAAPVIRRETVTIDSYRLASDREYAVAMLEKLEAMTGPGMDAATRASFASLRQMALIGAGRTDEAVALGQTILAARSEQPEAYSGVAVAALFMKRPALFLQAIEAAAARFRTPESRSAFCAGFRETLLDSGWRDLAGDVEGRSRFAEALLALDYYDAQDIEQIDTMRGRAAQGRLARGDLTGAQSLAAAITEPSVLVRLLLERRFDPLFGPGRDVGALVASAMAQADRRTATALEAKPQD